MADVRAASDSKESKVGRPSLMGDRLSRAVIGLGIGLALLTLAAMPVVGSAVAFGETQPVAELPWFLPVAQAFVILSGLAIAFLSAGRYLALGGSWVLWMGAVFLANAILSTFYLLSWPGLLGDHGLIASRSNTASWLFCVTFSSLVLLLPALRSRGRGAVRSMRTVYLTYGAVALLAALIGVLSVSFEDALPLMVSGGNFTALNLGWVVALSILMAASAAVAFQRYRRDPELVSGYLALFLVLMAFGLLYSIMGGKRYDPWWYAARALYDMAYVSMLLGLLQEGYSLFGRERERADERERLVGRLQDALKEAELSKLEVEQARDLAERAVSVRDEFISIAAHELKTPVTSLQGFSQLLIRQAVKNDGELDTERVLTAVQHIGEQSRRLTRLTEQLLDLSRLETGKLVLNREEMVLNTMVGNLVASIKHSHPERAIEVHGGEEVQVCADALRLEQVVTNLIDNALKFSPEESSIEVEVRRDGDGWARIAVRDHGIGIPEGKREQVFDRFFQAHAEQHYGGMGIGLSVSRQIAEMHGGAITVEQPEDGGSRFVVRLPAGPCEE
jgi:signal transduction histidine kinase